MASHAGCDEERRDDESMSAHFHNTQVPSRYNMHFVKHNDLTANISLKLTTFTNHVTKPSIHVTFT
jgi:hypothetical protein